MLIGKSSRRWRLSAAPASGGAAACRRGRAGAVLLLLLWGSAAAGGRASRCPRSCSLLRIDCGRSSSSCLFSAALARDGAGLR
eukprot:8726412-Lingulodinium_polyedra.AAC.1